MSAEHYKKTIGRNTEDKILKLIKESEPNGINTGQLKTKTGLSMPVLSNHLKNLENKELIENFRDPQKDRRFQWYRIKPENAETVKGQLGKYDAIKFIKEIHNPLYVFSKKGKVSVAAFSAVPATTNRKLYEETQKAILNKQALGFLKTFMGIKPNQRTALIIMVDGKDE